MAINLRAHGDKFSYMQKFICVYTEISLRICEIFFTHIRRVFPKLRALLFAFSHAIKRRAYARFAVASARQQPTLRDAREW